MYPGYLPVRGGSDLYGRLWGETLRDAEYSGGAHRQKRGDSDRPETISGESSSLFLQELPKGTRKVKKWLKNHRTYYKIR